MNVIAKLIVIFGVINSTNVSYEVLKQTENVDYPNLYADFTVIHKESTLLQKLFQAKSQNGFFHMRLNSTIPFFMDLRLCESEHNFYGSITKNQVCNNNARSYGFICHNTSDTNFEKRCTFNFCLDDDLFGQGVITCDVS